MQKFIITILGQDKPGILAEVSNFLFHLDCNIENVSQTILQSEFAGMFVISAPSSLSLNDLTAKCDTAFKDQQLTIHIKTLLDAPVVSPPPLVHPYILTTIGPDSKGLVAGMTGIIAQHQANITSLKAVFSGGTDPDKNFMVYEIDVPETVCQQTFIKSLRDKATSLGMEITIQHKNIFNAVNKI